MLMLPSCQRSTKTWKEQSSTSSTSTLHSKASLTVLTAGTVPRPMPFKPPRARFWRASLEDFCWWHWWPYSTTCAAVVITVSTGAGWTTTMISICDWPRKRARLYPSATMTITKTEWTRKSLTPRTGGGKPQQRRQPRMVMRQREPEQAQRRPPFPPWKTTKTARMFRPPPNTFTIAATTRRASTPTATTTIPSWIASRWDPNGPV
mmetsp:Transcript_11401/g.24072  ORF Transcript_11401/g.24072 Transcript_11401/m.24072 type:complete len:206 (-) Transcript_11401:720-1337(-)